MRKNNCEKRDKQNANNPQQEATNFVLISMKEPSEHSSLILEHCFPSWGFYSYSPVVFRIWGHAIPCIKRSASVGIKQKHNKLRCA